MAAIHHTPVSNSGFCCPKCGISTRVTDSRDWSFGTTRRRRECIGCGHRFHTIEAPSLPKGKHRTYPDRRVLAESGDLAAQHRARWERGRR